MLRPRLVGAVRPDMSGLLSDKRLSTPANVEEVGELPARCQQELIPGSTRTTIALSAKGIEVVEIDYGAGLQEFIRPGKDIPVRFVEVAIHSYKGRKNGSGSKLASQLFGETD